ncbi:MAG: sigma-E processing peptidase SpoIIGA [Oscillospiraceae bacterium]|nr:sigma-E processing peptidase SpoIIGA [Oscillospiraceae bacterium]
MRIYVDGVMAINFLVDGLLLLGTNRLTGFPADWKRTAAAALFGAVYSGVCLLPDLRFLGNFLWRAVSLLLMASIAFGWNCSTLRRTGVFFLLSLSLGGCSVMLNSRQAPALLMAAAGIWFLCRAAFGDPTGSREYIPLEIRRGDRTVKLLALRDTGNTLRDPITGEQALVISPEAACRLTGLTEEQLRTPLETMTAGGLPGLRLLPYHTVGRSGGMLLAMRFADVRIGSRKQSALVAFAPENFGGKEAYQALTGGVI